MDPPPCLFVLKALCGFLCHERPFPPDPLFDPGVSGRRFSSVFSLMSLSIHSSRSKHGLFLWITAFFLCGSTELRCREPCGRHRAPAVAAAGTKPAHRPSLWTSGRLCGKYPQTCSHRRPFSDLWGSSCPVPCAAAMPRRALHAMRSGTAGHSDGKASPPFFFFLFFMSHGGWDPFVFRRAEGGFGQGARRWGFRRPGGSCYSIKGSSNT